MKITVNFKLTMTKHKTNIKTLNTYTNNGQNTTYKHKKKQKDLKIRTETTKANMLQKTTDLREKKSQKVGRGPSSAPRMRTAADTTGTESEVREMN